MNRAANVYHYNFTIRMLAEDDLADFTASGDSLRRDIAGLVQLYITTWKEVFKQISAIMHNDLRNNYILKGLSGTGLSFGQATIGLTVLVWMSIVFY